MFEGDKVANNVRYFSCLSPNWTQVASKLASRTNIVLFGRPFLGRTALRLLSSSSVPVKIGLNQPVPAVLRHGTTGQVRQVLPRQPYSSPTFRRINSRSWLEKYGQGVEHDTAISENIEKEFRTNQNETAIGSEEEGRKNITEAETVDDDAAAASKAELESLIKSQDNGNEQDANEQATVYDQHSFRPTERAELIDEGEKRWNKLFRDRKGHVSRLAEPNETVFVGNLFYDMTAGQLRAQMERFGTVTAARIIFDTRGLSKG